MEIAMYTKLCILISRQVGFSVTLVMFFVGSRILLSSCACVQANRVENECKRRRSDICGITVVAKCCSGALPGTAFTGVHYIIAMVVLFSRSAAWPSAASPAGDDANPWDYSAFFLALASLQRSTLPAVSSCRSH